MRVVDDPKLLPFLPLLYVAWSDGDLTDAEIEELRERAIPDVLVPWLDPKAPPTSDELTTMRRILRARGDGERGSLASFGEKLSHEPAMLEEARRLEHALGLDGREPTRLIVGDEVHPPILAKPTFAVAVMTALIDGRYADARRSIRELLPTLQRHEVTSREAYRTVVLNWLGELCTRGIGEKAFPEDGRGLGEFIAIFETLASFDLSLVVKFGVQLGLFGGSIYFLGGDAQKKVLLPRVASLELLGCFAMSELGHGSNVRDLETVARYDHETRSFELHTPSESARKEWIGGAARDARMATVFAQLEVAGEGRGVHAFLVPLRDDRGNALPGIRLEDCGEKMGLNGVDNGRIWFDRVRIPLATMLDRYASIDENGHYQSPIASDSKRFFTMLGTLVGGRVSVAAAALTAAKTALKIAVRYGDRRRQFGAPGAPETLLNDYPTHQRRLMPLVAEAYALTFAHQHLVDRYEAGADAREVEALAAGIKSIATWFTTGAVQVCRECCGGQGYLTENQFAALKADTDVFTTFEGDNTVLMQLVAKGVLTEFRAQFNDAKLFAVARHLARRAATAVTEQNPIATRRTAAEHLRSSEFQLSALRFRETSLTASVAARLRKRLASGNEATEAFVAVQPHLLSLARAHIERVIFEAASARVAAADETLRAPLTRVLDLYALARIEDDLAWFLENDYIETGKARAIRKEVDLLCAEVRIDAVSLVDSFAIEVSAPIAC